MSRLSAEIEQLLQEVERVLGIPESAVSASARRLTILEEVLARLHGPRLQCGLLSLCQAWKSGDTVERSAALALALILAGCAPSTPAQSGQDPGQSASSAAEAKADLWRLIDTWRTPQDLGPASLERAFDITLSPDGRGRKGSRSLDGGKLTISVGTEGPNFRIAIMFPLPQAGQACAMTIGELVAGLRERGHEVLLSDVHALRQSWSFPSQPRGGYVLSVYALTEPEVKSKDDLAPCVSEVELFSMEANNGQAVP